MVFLASSKAISETNLENILGVQELADLANIDSKKKSDWLAGRLAVKKAVRFFCLNEAQFRLKLSEIEINSRKFHKPRFKIRNKREDAKLKKAQKFMDISIAHSDGMGVGAASDIRKEGLIGVDIEKIRKFDRKIKETFLTEWEWASLKKREKKSQNEIATIFWCLKEAYLKALGRGLTKHPKSIELNLDYRQKKCIIKENNVIAKATAVWSVLPGNYVLAKVNVQLS